jgi:hypothetical protein
MRIIEQYLHEVGRRVPAKGRSEIVNELRSLLLDELEQKYGSGADEEAAKQVLAEFGPPAEVAQRYSGRSQVIAGGVSDLYFLIMKIMLGAMAIAFTVVYIVELAAGSVDSARILGRTLELPLQILSAFLTGTGALTLVFMGITRAGWNEGLDPNADWTPEELKDVELEPETESRLGHIFSIAGSMVAIALLNLYPEIFTVLEEAFLRSTLSLGHRLNIDLLRGYLIPITIVMAFEIGYHAIGLRVEGQTSWLRLSRTGITLASIVVTALMVGDMRLYLDYTGMIGFRLIFVIALVGNIIGLITEIVSYGKVKLHRRAVGERGAR